MRSGGYLCLLRMGSPGDAAVLAKIADVMTSTVDHSRYLKRLLDDRNWRSHLIALVAALLSNDAAAFAPMLWEAFDRGSWVAPQLAVSLYCCDPNFVVETRRRIS